MEDDCIFYSHSVNFTVFCYILCTFGIVHVNLAYLFLLWYFIQQKSGNPVLKMEKGTGR
jgi:hypothetical protein